MPLLESRKPADETVHNDFAHSSCNVSEKGTSLAAVSSEQKDPGLKHSRMASFGSFIVDRPAKAKTINSIGQELHRQKLRSAPVLDLAEKGRLVFACPCMTRETEAAPKKKSSREKKAGKKLKVKPVRKHGWTALTAREDFEPNPADHQTASLRVFNDLAQKRPNSADAIYLAGDPGPRRRKQSLRTTWPCCCPSRPNLWSRKASAPRWKRKNAKASAGGGRRDALRRKRKFLQTDPKKIFRVYLQ